MSIAIRDKNESSKMVCWKAMRKLLTAETFVETLSMAFEHDNWITRQLCFLKFKEYKDKLKKEALDPLKKYPDLLVKFLWETVPDSRSPKEWSVVRSWFLGSSIQYTVYSMF